MKSNLNDSRHMPGKSSTCFRLFPKAKSVGSNSGISPVYLNVYDLTPINGYVYWAGVGIFHTGVEVHGVEYAFGAHDCTSSGVFEVEPRKCPGFKFRKSIFVGTTYLDPVEVRKFMEHLSVKYSGDSYHLIGKNCNHFSGDICRKLTGKRIPKWVNRLARIGSFCKCLLPESLKDATISPSPEIQVCDSEKRRLRNSSNCVSTVSMDQPKDKDISSLFWRSNLDSCLSPSDLKKSRNDFLKRKR